MLANLLHRNLEGISAVQSTRIGNMQIAVIDREQSAALLIEEAMKRREEAVPPLLSSSVNGQVLSFYAANKNERWLFDHMDINHADGMSLVWASRMVGTYRLPERVATTDLFHDTAKVAIERGATFYMLGATQQHLSQAVANVRRLYPDLKLVGARNGYFSDGDVPQLLEEINQCNPDVLWVSMGVPREQLFCLANRAALTGVGVVKTSGGLFDFLSGTRRRAPQWMQDWSLEWLYRLFLEPRRLFWRYLTTNIHATYLLLTK